MTGGRPLAELARPFDMVGVAFSKGLGAPAASILAGGRDVVQRAVRYRRMFGGAMRRIGILGPACLYALDHNIERLSEDHANARRIAEWFAASPRILLDPALVQTNSSSSVWSTTHPMRPLSSRARERGVLIFGIGARVIRVVTHLDVSRKQCDEGAEILAAIAES